MGTSVGWEIDVGPYSERAQMISQSNLPLERTEFHAANHDCWTRPDRRLDWSRPAGMVRTDEDRASRLSSLRSLTLTSNSNTTRKIEAVDNTEVGFDEGRSQRGHRHHLHASDGNQRDV